MNKGTALITGGAKRIGLKLATRLAKEGYTIALHYNSSSVDAEKALEEIAKIQPESRAYQCNLLDLESVEQFVDEVVKNHPNLSVLINNASIYEKYDISETTPSTLIRDMSIHFFAPFLLTKAFAKNVNNGVIINFLDAGLRRRATGNASYYMSKNALMTFTEAAALELAPHIRVNGIAPGLMQAPEGKPIDYEKNYASTVPLGRIPSTENITDALMTLIENDYLTGQIIYLDGGKNL